MMSQNQTYWMGVSLYQTDETIPKIIAKENENILKDGMIAGNEEKQFYITLGKELQGRILWYEKDGTWVKAENRGNVRRIPGDAMQYHTICRSPFCAAKVRVAFTQTEREPEEEMGKIMICHFLKDAEKQNEAEK